MNEPKKRLSGAGKLAALALLTIAGVLLYNAIDDHVCRDTVPNADGCRRGAMLRVEEGVAVCRCVVSP